MWGTEVVVMAVMVVLNGLLAAYEIALASIPEVRLRNRAEQGSSAARAALHMKENIEASLAVVQVGITLVGALAAATAGAGAQQALKPVLESRLGISPTFAEAVSIILVVIPLTLTLILFGELIPKVFALRNPEWVMLRMSRPMRWFSFAVWPVVWLLEIFVKGTVQAFEKLWKENLDDSQTGSTELQDVRASATLARTSRLIGTHQEKIIHEATDLSRRTIGDVMLPIEFISTLQADMTAGDALVAAHMDMHTRFPVTSVAGDLQQIEGYVNFKDIVSHLRFAPREPNIRPILRQIASYPADLPVASAMERLIRDHTHIAMVRDDDGAALGMITLEDIMEELVGDIEDEYDRLPGHLVPTGQGWIVGGGISLKVFARETGITLPRKPDIDCQTLNDWILAHHEGPIQGFEQIETPAAHVQVRKSRRHKVMEAYIARRPQES